MTAFFDNEFNVRMALTHLHIRSLTRCAFVCKAFAYAVADEIECRAQRPPIAIPHASTFTPSRRFTEAMWCLTVSSKWCGTVGAYDTILVDKCAHYCTKCDGCATYACCPIHTSCKFCGCAIAPSRARWVSGAGWWFMCADCARGAVVVRPVLPLHIRCRSE